MPKKKQSFDYFKLIPIGVLAISSIAGFITLKNDVAAAKEKLKDHSQEITETKKDLQIANNKQSEDVAQIKVSQAQTQQKVDLAYEVLKEIKDSIKDLKK